MKLLVAVSGGMDSMCLAEKVRLSGGPFAIAHCNFSLRGAESDADEALVRSWAERYGVPLHVRRFDTAAHASENGISIEMAARRLRYRWFGQLCREHGYGGVAVAHHAQDNAETLILNLLRGTGLKGILGMKKEGFLPDPDYADIPLLRPLLDMDREEIAAFVLEHGVPFREDTTNAENEFKRNKIRNLVFPVFREINPSFVRTLNRDMERFAEEMAGHGGKAGFHTRDESPVPDRPPVSYTVTEESWDGSKNVKQPEGELILDADKAGAYVEGHWEQGDWIRPLGAPGRKKMQDWFTDHHFTQEEKHRSVLLKDGRDASHVLAVVGHTIDESVKVTSGTRRILRIVIS